MRTYLTATEFARHISKDPKTVIGWIEKGWIKGAKRVGYYYQVPLKELEVYRKSPQYPPKKWRK